MEFHREDDPHMITYIPLNKRGGDSVDNSTENDHLIDPSKRSTRAVPGKFGARSRRPPIDVNDSNDAVRHTSRSTITAQAASKLVKSKIASHTAAELCDSPTSSGPDFVSFESGQFCDMDTKQLWAICGSDQDADCFDTEANDLRILQRLGKREVLVLAKMKDYKDVTNWG
ncbi:MAG: hypothetical protein Q9191_001329 [Dirinaria sp. TL-2023a]